MRVGVVGVERGAGPPGAEGARARLPARRLRPPARLPLALPAFPIRPATPRPPRPT